MFSLKFCSIVILVFANVTIYAVKVNLKGSLKLGQDILNMISRSLQESFLKDTLATDNTRRAGSDSNTLPMFARLLAAITGEARSVRLAVHDEDFCSNLTFCQDPVKKSFVVDYVSMLGNAVDSILASVLNQDKVIPGSIFIGKLKEVLKEAHKILRHADKHTKPFREAYEWVSVLKRISAVVMDRSTALVYEKLPGHATDVQKLRKPLMQKLVIAVVMVENRYESRLCTDHHFCVHDYEVTDSLHMLLDELCNTTDQRATEFVRSFYEYLPDYFYHIIDHDTAYEFQMILSELSFSSSVAAKDVLASVLRAVKARKENLETRDNVTKNGIDSELINIILSDMDHFYSHVRKNSFHHFMDVFTEWLRAGGKLGPQIRDVIRDIQKNLMLIPRDLVNKLRLEIRIFLELTVDVTEY